MNKKDKKYVKERIINIRLTSEEEMMAKELREKCNINISSLIRNTIRAEHEKINQKA
jgi:post-segregation antitoxin (ccd killing protein)